MAHELRRIGVRNWRGITDLSVTIGKSGAVAKGRGGTGKTSFVEAFRACLTTAGVDPKAIRNGADSAEIMVDLDDVSIRCIVTKDGTTRSLTPANGGKVLRGTSATAGLREMFPGGCGVDPFPLLFADTIPQKRERWQLLADAVPFSVTVADLRRWCPKLPEDYDTSGPGLDVLARVRDLSYKARHAANAKRDADVAEADRARMALPPDCPGNWGSVADVEDDVRRGEAAVTRLRSQDAESRASVERSAASRAKVAEFRKVAEVSRHDAKLLRPAPSKVARTRDSITKLDAKVMQLRADLESAELAIAGERLVLAGFDTDTATCDKFIAAAERAESAATDIEATIASASTSPVDPETIAEAEKATAALREKLTNARAGLAYDKAAGKWDALVKAAKESAAEAERLDVMVRGLTDEAPAVLLAASGGIEGLELRAEHQVLLDGVDLDLTSGSQRMRLCVDLAKRTAGRGKLLIIDGLERVGPEGSEELRAFTEYATADGWTLIASLVVHGEMRIVGLEAA